MVTAAANTSKRHVLLQTARANTVNTDGSRTIPVTVLFDNGSQRSYVTDSLKWKLELTPDKNETLHLNTFGDNKYKTQKCQVVTLNFETSNGDVCPISALNFPVICRPLGTNFNVADYPHLQDLDLANSPIDKRQTIDVLIGSGHYWDFITGEVIQGENGPVAIASKFGWVLSGLTHVSVGDNESEVLSNLIIFGGGNKFADYNENPHEITSELKRFWDVEAIGISNESPNESYPLSSKLISGIEFNWQCYEVSLPWKNECLPLPDNYESCNNVCCPCIESFEINQSCSPSTTRQLKINSRLALSKGYRIMRLNSLIVLELIIPHTTLSSVKTKIQRRCE